MRLVGERGFEPPTPWSRTRCSTRLSHSPTNSQVCAKRKETQARAGFRRFNYNILHDASYGLITRRGVRNIRHRDEKQTRPWEMSYNWR
jgi:hypothetical protein